MENNQNFSPNKGHGKDKEFQGNEPIKINPDFSDLDNPDIIFNHIEQLKRTKEVPVPHKEILSRLLDEIFTIDFEELANPNKAENFRLKEKHYLVLTIENIRNIAENQNWGICKKHDFIYLFNGTFWAEIDKEEFQKFLGEAAERMGVGVFLARHYLFREKLFKQFLSNAYLSTPESKNDTVLINLSNGTFEISPQSTKLRPFDSSDFLTYQLPFEYDPQAKAPLFEAYLKKVLPDKERQRVLAEFLGFVFIKHGSNALKEEKALILYGTGANGKSVFFEIVNALLGAENVSSFSLQNLTNDNGYFRAKMANKLVNYASEINGKLEASVFKQLVSGEPVEARLPYGQPFMLKQYAKLIFNCNELPKDVEHTNAYFRRFLIIPFDVTIPEAEQDKNLHTKIIETELSGVFNWVLEGLNKLLQQKRFSDCEAAQKAVEQYKIESNSIKQFLDENGYKSSPINYRLLKELYPEYRTFCMEDGMTAFKKINFSKQLQTMGFVIDRQPGTGQKIVYLKKEDSPF
jgi:putative DNA primase/helicase